MSVLYEKGSAAWDIGVILTRHGDGRVRTQNGDYLACARLADIRRTAGHPDAQHRLRLALAVPCTCGAGDSVAEMTSLRSVGSDTIGQGTLAGGTEDVTDGPGTGLPVEDPAAT